VVSIILLRHHCGAQRFIATGRFGWCVYCASVGRLYGSATGLRRLFVHAVSPKRVLMRIKKLLSGTLMDCCRFQWQQQLLQHALRGALQDVAARSGVLHKRAVGLHPLLLVAVCLYNHVTNLAQTPRHVLVLFRAVSTLLGDSSETGFCLYCANLAGWLAAGWLAGWLTMRGLQEKWGGGLLQWILSPLSGTLHVYLPQHHPLPNISITLRVHMCEALLHVQGCTFSSHEC